MSKNQPKLPRFCVSCGVEFAMPHRIFCPSCFLQAQKRRAELASQRAKRYKYRKSGKTVPATLLPRTESEYLRQHPANFKASNAAIRRQIQWMRENDLLPDPRRLDCDPTKSHCAKQAHRGR